MMESVIEIMGAICVFIMIYGVCLVCGIGLIMLTVIMVKDFIDLVKQWAKEICNETD